MVGHIYNKYPAESKKPEAFTLMETTLALALLSIGVIGLSAAFSQIVKANATTERKSTAMLLAEAKLAWLRTSNFSEIGELKGTFSKPF